MRESIKNLFFALIVLMVLIHVILAFAVFYTFKTSGTPRARTARTVSEINALSSSILLFYNAHNRLPIPSSSHQIVEAHMLINNRIHTLTTPIAYINNIPHDPYRKYGEYYRYYADGQTW